jgi:RimJ/RimL family protein N-acetyltransferase
LWQFWAALYGSHGAAAKEEAPRAAQAGVVIPRVTASRTLLLFAHLVDDARLWQRRQPSAPHEVSRRPMSVFFSSERLWFRALEAADAPRVATWINDPRVRKHLATRVFPLSLEAEEEWVKRVSAPPSPSAAVEQVVLAFGPQGSETPIGNTGLHGFNWIIRRAEWGIVIGEPEYWNQGYGREVARRMLQYAFEDLNLNRVELRVNTANAAALKAYAAAGFVREGTLRQAAWVEGRHEDILVMSVLRQEWKK